MDEDAAREVVAMQFAGGMSIARLVATWERDQAWVEESIRSALLALIPERDGGLKAPRALAREERRNQQGEVDGQGELEFVP